MAVRKTAMPTRKSLKTAVISARRCTVMSNIDFIQSTAPSTKFEGISEQIFNPSNQAWVGSDVGPTATEHSVSRSLSLVVTNLVASFNLKNNGKTKKPEGVEKFWDVLRSEVRKQHP